MNDRDEVAGVLVGLGRLDGYELVFTSLSYGVVIVEDLRESLSYVLNLFNVHCHYCANY